MNKSVLSVCIIGHGRLGKFFEALLMPMKGIRVFIKHKHEPRYPAVDVFLICVQDQWVSKVVEELTVHEQDQVFSAVHCSGILPLNVLSPLAEVNGEGSRWNDNNHGVRYESEFNKIAVLHPLAPINSQMVSAENILFDAIGDPELLLIFEHWCKYWGARLIKVDAHQKKILHTAAVMSCNYLTTLYGMVEDFLEFEQFSKVEVRQILSASMGRTLEQLDDISVEKAMTGPIIRGDIDTIREHLAILKDDQQRLGLYKNLGNSTIDMISKFKCKPSEDIIKVMRALFNR